MKKKITRNTVKLSDRGEYICQLEFWMFLLFMLAKGSAAKPNNISKKYDIS